MNQFTIGRDNATGEIIFENHAEDKVVLYFNCKSFEYSKCGRNKNGNLYLAEGTVQNTDEGLSDLLEIMK